MSFVYLSYSSNHIALKEMTVEWGEMHKQGTIDSQDRVINEENTECAVQCAPKERFQTQL